MREVIVMVGLPRSGKSTWAEKQNLPIVSRDSIRLALHGKRYIQEMESFVSLFEKTMIESLFLSGHKKVIIDGCHMKTKYIDSWRESGYQVVEKLIITSVEECKRRAVETDQSDLIEVIDRMMCGCNHENFLEKMGLIDQLKELREINERFKI